MKLTIVQIAMNGSVDPEKCPLVFPSHLSKEQCTRIAREIGDGYPAMALVECDEADIAVFYANFSNMEDPPLNSDWTIEHSSQGELELWFYHEYVQ